MLTYLQKYNDLPTELKERVSTPSVMGAIMELEKKYHVSIANVIMRVMVREISILDLPKFFVFEYNFIGKQAEEIVGDLKTSVFRDVADYLGFASDTSGTKDPEELDDWINERKSDTAIRSSNFFFSPEDEEEVKELTKKVQSFRVEKKEEKIVNEKLLREKVDRVVKSVNLNFSSEELANRFWHIIYTYLKGVRNKIDTRAALLKDVNSGGLSLNESLASRSLTVADQVSLDYIKQEIAVGNIAKDIETREPIKPPSPQTAGIHPEGTVTTEDSALAGLDESGTHKDPKLEEARNNLAAKTSSRDFDYDYSALKKKNPSTPQERLSIAKATERQAGQEKHGEDLKHEHTLNLKDELKEEIKKVENAVSEEKVIDLSLDKEKSSITGPPKVQIKDIGGNNNIIKPDLDAVKRPSPMPSPPRAVSNQTANRNGKIKMEDVKYVPKLSGPIDELADMDITNFRRLNEDPSAATKKIKEKIEFLEDDSYAKRLKGVKAWRECPVNKLYLSMGEKSINKSKSIDNIISESSDEGDEVLSKKEFIAIMELNKMLRF